MGKAKHDIPILIFETLVAIICWGSFIYLTKDVWDKFSHQFTSTGVRFSDVGLTSKELPCFTLCPWKSFKEKGFHYENTDFMNSTFEQHELIDLGNSSDLYNVTTLKSIFLGRCYTICSSKKIKKKETVMITLLKATDVTGSKISQTICWIFFVKHDFTFGEHLFL